MNVIKKDGSIEQFDINKVVEACALAAANCSKTLSDGDIEGIKANVLQRVEKRKKDISTETLGKYAIIALRTVDTEIADQYKNFHQFRKNIIRELNEVRRKVDSLKYAGDRENANYDSSLFSTQSAIYRGWHSRMASEAFYLNKAERDAIKCGKLYIHDLRDIMFGNHNCCVFAMERVLSNGFTINGREDVYEWTSPYVDNSQVVVVLADSGIKTLADLSGKTVVTANSCNLQIGKNTHFFGHI